MVLCYKYQSDKRSGSLCEECFDCHPGQTRTDGSRINLLLQFSLLRSLDYITTIQGATRIASTEPVCNQKQSLFFLSDYFSDHQFEVSHFPQNHLDQSNNTHQIRGNTHNNNQSNLY